MKTNDVTDGGPDSNKLAAPAKRIECECLILT